MPRVRHVARTPALFSSPREGSAARARVRFPDSEARLRWQIEEEMKGVDVETVADKLEDFALSGSPRYLLYIYKFAHADGRVQFPIAFVLLMPEQTPLELKVLYTRPVVSLCDTFKVNKHFPLDDPEDFDADWLETKLGLAGK